MKKKTALRWVAILVTIAGIVIAYLVWCASPFIWGRNVRISQTLSPKEKAQVMAILRSEGWLEPRTLDFSTIIDCMNPTTARKYRTVEVHVQEDGMFEVSGMEGGHGGFSFTPDSASQQLSKP